LTLCDTPAERGRIHVVDERALTPDLDHRQPFAVAGLQVVVAVDLDVLEPILAQLREQRLARTLAQMTAARAVEDDPTDRSPELSSPPRPA
jgi:hypothetical protein